MEKGKKVANSGLEMASVAKGKAQAERGSEEFADLLWCPLDFSVTLQGTRRHFKKVPLHLLPR